MLYYVSKSLSNMDDEKNKILWFCHVYKNTSAP